SVHRPCPLLQARVGISFTLVRYIAGLSISSQGFSYSSSSESTLPVPRGTPYHGGKSALLYLPLRISFKSKSIGSSSWISTSIGDTLSGFFLALCSSSSECSILLLGGLPAFRVTLVFLVIRWSFIAISGDMSILPALEAFVVSSWFKLKRCVKKLEDDAKKEVSRPRLSDAVRKIVEYEKSVKEKIDKLNERISILEAKFDRLFDRKNNNNEEDYEEYEDEEDEGEEDEGEEDEGEEDED
ncbi:18145_t:CDS:2, partial [Acaulospora morrowiae]